MFVDFDEMPDEARIWIYQADRAFSDEEVVAIEHQCIDFLTQWTAHGAGLKSSAKVFYNRFLIMCVDEEKARASGCSIDSSVHFVKNLGSALKTDFFNRTQVAFLKEDKVFVESLENIKNHEGSITLDESTPTFDNMVQTKSDLGSMWIIPISESWLSRYFKTQKI